MDSRDNLRNLLVKRKAEYDLNLDACKRHNPDADQRFSSEERDYFSGVSSARPLVRAHFPDIAPFEDALLDATMSYVATSTARRAVPAPTACKIARDLPGGAPAARKSARDLLGGAPAPAPAPVALFKLRSVSTVMQALYEPGWPRLWVWRRGKQRLSGQTSRLAHMSANLISVCGIGTRQVALDRIGTEDYVTICHEDKDRIVSALVYRVWKRQNQLVADVVYLATAPDYVRRGHATRLVDKLIEHMRAQAGAIAWRLFVEVDRGEEATAFWTSRAGVKVDRISTSIRQDVHRVVGGDFRGSEPMQRLITAATPGVAAAAQQRAREAEVAPEVDMQGGDLQSLAELFGISMYPLLPSPPADEDWEQGPLPPPPPPSPERCMVPLSQPEPRRTTRGSLLVGVGLCPIFETHPCLPHEVGAGIGMSVELASTARAWNLVEAAAARFSASPDAEQQEMAAAEAEASAAVEKLGGGGDDGTRAGEGEIGGDDIDGWEDDDDTRAAEAAAARINAAAAGKEIPQPTVGGARALVYDERWCATRLEQVKMHMKKLHSGLPFAYFRSDDEYDAAVEDCRGALGALKANPSLGEDTDGYQQTGSPLFWAILITQNRRALGRDGWSADTEQGCQLWSANAMHDWIEHYKSERKNTGEVAGTATSVGHGMVTLAQIGQKYRHLRVDSLGTEQARFDKGNVLDGLLLAAGRPGLCFAVKSGKLPRQHHFEQSSRAAMRASVGARWGYRTR